MVKISQLIDLSITNILKTILDFQEVIEIIGENLEPVWPIVTWLDVGRVTLMNFDFV